MTRPVPSPAMKPLSVNVGTPRPNPWNGLSATGTDK